MAFATAARLSEINLGLYRTFLQPWVKAMASEESAKAMRELHPNRVRFAAFSDRNPLTPPVKEAAQAVRAERKPVSADNPFLAFEQAASTWISTWLDTYRIARDGMTEAFFVNLYGSPVLQALMGLGAEQGHAHRRIERDLAREVASANARKDLEKLFEVGGMAEAAIRALVYVRLPEGRIDERGFSMLLTLRALKRPEERLSLADVKELFRTQFLLIRLDEERAVSSLPRLLPDDMQERRATLEVLHRVLTARGQFSDEEARRFARIEAIFTGTESAPATRTA